MYRASPIKLFTFEVLSMDKERTVRNYNAIPTSMRSVFNVDKCNSFIHIVYTYRRRHDETFKCKIMHELTVLIRAAIGLEVKDAEYKYITHVSPDLRDDLLFVYLSKAESVSHMLHIYTKLVLCEK